MSRSERDRLGGQVPIKYSPVPRPRRGNRRAQGGSAPGGREPRLAGIQDLLQKPEASEDSELVRWLKEQRPPHYQ